MSIWPLYLASKSHDFYSAFHSSPLQLMRRGATIEKGKENTFLCLILLEPIYLEPGSILIQGIKSVIKLLSFNNKEIDVPTRSAD